MTRDDVFGLAIVLVGFALLASAVLQVWAS